VHPPFRKLTVALVVIAVGAMALASCKQPSPASGNRVLLVGDSIFAASRDHLRNSLSEAGWDPVVQAQAGSAIEDWVSQLHIAIENAGGSPNLVVIELGTNDCGTVACTNLAPHIDAIMRQLDFADAVLWLTVQTDALIPEKPDYVNSQIEAAAGRWPKLFIVDMGGLFEGHDDWRKDGTHPNIKGSNEMVNLILDELEGFRPTAG
jgi:GDSL-like Lipase/Acylhydrolase family